MKLWDASVGKIVKVVAFYDEQLTERLKTYGIIEQAILKIEKKNGAGIIVSSRGRLLAMDRSYACIVGVEYENRNNGQPKFRQNNLV